MENIDWQHLLFQFDGRINRLNGDLNAQTFASGISKMIDEMDIFENRKKQVSAFSDAEEEMWDLILHKQHPVWVRGGMIENRALFSENAKVNERFSNMRQLAGTLRRALS